MNEPTTLVTEERPSGVTVVRFQGDLDSMGTHLVEDQFDTAVANSAGDVVADLGRVGFISSAGMAMLLVRGKALRRRGARLSLAAASPRVLEVLSLAGFNELFEVYPTVEAALAALEAPLQP